MSVAHRALFPAVAGLTAGCLALAFCFAADEPWALRGDNKLIHFPMQLEAVRLWAEGQVPFWTDRLWMGYPLLANPETGALYPPRLVGYWLTDAPHVRAFDWAFALHAAWLVAGSAAFLRALGCGVLAATFGGAMALLATQSVVMTSYLANFCGVAWWPWLLLAAGHLAATRERVLGAVLLASVPLAAQVYAGNPEVAFQGGCLAAVWMLAAPGETPLLARFGRVAALVATAVALSAPQLFPTASILGDTRRGLPQETRSLLAIDGTLRDTIDPWSAGGRTPFLGAATLLLAGVALLRRAPRAIDLSIVALVAGLGSLGDATPVYALLGKLPGFALFRGPYKLLIIAQFSLAWLAALGVQSLVRRPGEDAAAQGGGGAGPAPRPSLAALAGVALCVLALSEYALAFRAVLPRVAGPHTKVEVPLSRGLDELASVAPLLTESRPGPVPPRVFTGSNTVRMGGLPSVAFVEMVRGGGVSLLPERHAWLNFGYLGPDHMNLFGVDLVLAQGECAEPSRLGYEMVARGRGVCVLENPTPRPRYEIVSAYQRVASVDELVGQARRRPAQPIAVLAADDAALPAADGTASGTVVVEALAPGDVELSTVSTAPALLLVRQSWGAGWSATVDGGHAAIHPAAGVFFVVPVPEGRHTVRLTYRAPGFHAGLACAAVWLALAGFAVRSEARARRTGAAP